MALTEREEAILKANAQVMQAHAEWNKEAQVMGDKIRAAFNTEDQRFRAQHKAELERLQAVKEAAEANLKTLLES